MEFIHSVTISDQPYALFGLPDDEKLPAPRDSINMFNDLAFDSYVFEIVNVVPVTNATYMRAQVYTAALGGFDTTTTSYTSNGVPTAYFQINYTGSTWASAGFGLTQSHTLYNAHNTAVASSFIPSNGSNFVSGGGQVQTSARAMVYRPTENIQGIRFFFSTGNLLEGRITMYGIRKSFDY